MFKAYMPGQTVKLLMQSDGDIVVRKLVLTAELGEDAIGEAAAGDAGDEF